ncbi:MAG: MFS transporter [Chloroflexi bacterium]|nr:MFS transporter [Chloroflexota bacterium]
MNSSPRLHYSWVVLGMGVLVVFGSLGLARFGYSMILPEMKEGLGIGSTGAGVLAASGLLGYLALSIIGGVIASRIGARIVIAVGLLATGVGMILTGFANGLLMAVSCQLLAGMGSGASNVPVMGLLASWFAPKKLGLASGVAVTGSSLGLIFVGSIVPPILGANDEDGWRTAWVLFGGITILLAVMAMILLRNNPAEKGLKPVGDNDGNSEIVTRAKGLHWGKVYRSAAVWHLGLVYIAFGMSYIIFMTFFKDHLTSEGGYTDESAGNLFMLIGCVSLLCGVIWGTVSDHIGRKRALVIVYLIHTIAFSIFALWLETAGFILAAVLFGLSAWSIPAIMTAACGDLLGPRLAPAALGFITLFFGIGQVIGPSVAGVMADAADTHSPAFLFAAGVAFLGAIGALRLRPTTKVPINPHVDT